MKSDTPPPGMGTLTRASGRDIGATLVAGSKNPTLGNWNVHSVGSYPRDSTVVGQVVQSSRSEFL